MTALVGTYLAVAAGAFALLGLFALVDPSGAVSCVGLRIASAAGRDEARASYSVLQLALAALLGAGSRRALARHPALALTTAVCAGLAGGRGSGLLSDGRLSASTVGWLVLEIGAGALGGWFFRRNAAPARQTADTVAA
jgi:hypothetical protein